jgi:hypothetical protein
MASAAAIGSFEIRASWTLYLLSQSQACGNSEAANAPLQIKLPGSTALRTPRSGKWVKIRPES